MNQSFWEHAEELRRTLVAAAAIVGTGFLIAWIWFDTLFAALISPLTQMQPHALVILSPLEGLITTFSLCFWFALTTTSPLWGYLLLRFIAPALREREQRLLLPFFVLSLLFLSAGISLAYWVTIPFANQYLYAWNHQLGQNLWSLSAYLDYTLFLLFANALAFELALLLFLCVHYQLVSAQWLREKRRVMILIIFILSALLTPPDILSQLMLAFPLIGLYELIIGYQRIFISNKVS